MIRYTNLICWEPGASPIPSNYMERENGVYTVGLSEPSGLPEAIRDPHSIPYVQADYTSPTYDLLDLKPKQL